MAVYAVVLVFIVWWPTSQIASSSVIHIWFFLRDLGAPGWVTPRKIEFGTNILLFMPLSFLGATFRPRWGFGTWLLVGFLGTSAIELTQLLVLTARSATIYDVLANTLGTVAGYAAVVAWRWGCRWVGRGSGCPEEVSAGR